MLYLYAGYDLAFSWQEALKALKEELPLSLLENLGGGVTPERRGMTETLNRLACDYPEISHRVWFGTISELYQSGAALLPAIKAVTRTLRAEQGREFSQHCDSLPVRLNVCLILFFFPPVMALLIAPLLAEMMNVF